MKITWQEGYRFEAETRGIRFVSDQREPWGTNQGPEPAELLAASLGACVGVYASSYLQRHGIPMTGLEIDVDWSPATEPKRIGAFTLQVRLPHALDARQRTTLERTIQGCMIHNTLHHPPDIRITLEAPSAPE